MNQSFMKEKPVFPLLTSMALPMVISMLVNSLYNIIDSFFVAQISEQAMTALSLVYPVQNLINAIAIGFGVGMNALIALCLGAGDVKNADRAATHGMLFSIVHGIVITVVSIGIMPFFLSLFTKDTEVLQLGTRYASIAFSFSLIIMLGLAFEKIFQAVGNMKITMAALRLYYQYYIRPSADFRHRFSAAAWHCRCSTCNRYRSDCDVKHLPCRIFFTSASGAYPPLLFKAARCNRQKTVCNRRACHFKSGSAVPAGFFLKCTAGGIFTELCCCSGNLL